MVVSELSVGAQEYSPIDANRAEVAKFAKTDGECMREASALRPLIVDARAKDWSYNQRLDIGGDLAVVDNAHKNLDVGSS